MLHRNEKSQNQIHLILSSRQVGGMEKRFVGFWLFQQQLKQVDIILVSTPSLIENLRMCPEFKMIDLFSDHIRFLDEANEKIGILKSIMRYKYRNPEGVFHYIMRAPILMFNFNSIYSFTCNSFSLFSRWHKIYLAYQFVSRKYIDILDPLIKEKVSKYLFFKRNQINLTSNSALLLSNSSFIPYEKRTNKIVFMSRFVKGKGIELLLQSIPTLVETLQKNMIYDAKLVFLGSGELEDKIRSSIQPALPMSIEVKFVNDVESELHDAKIFLSLQQYNNYPSRSLIEALSLGVLPIVTNCGNSSDIAKKEFANYIPEDFKPNELSIHIINLLQEESATLNRKAQSAIDFIQQNCKMKTMSDYYVSLYTQLGIKTS
jgi:glycosyltransferase involved in cell wall biosynthesis